MPAGNCWGQTAQQDYLRQQAAALKSQMVRAEVEQAAAPGFAAQAYDAQRAYLRSTAEKSFRVEKPSTSPNARFIEQGESFDVARAMPPVHVSPSPHSVAPQPNRQAPQRFAAPQARRAVRPTPHVVDLPTPAQLGYEGQSYAGPGNSVALQDRIANLITKTKRAPETKGAPEHNRRLPSPKFTVDRRQEVHYVNQVNDIPPRQPEQPLFRRDKTNIAVPSRVTPRSNDASAYQRMALAIESRETNLNAPKALPQQVELARTPIAQVSLTEPVSRPSNQEFLPPQSLKTQREARQPFPTQEVSRSRQIPAQQISVLSKPPTFGRQEQDNGFGLPVPNTAAPDQELPLRDQLDSDDTFNSLRSNRSPQINRKQEIEELEKKIRKLEQQEPDVDTRRRQRELEAAEDDAATQRDRNDFQKDLRQNDEEDDDRSERPTRKTCDEYRTGLLNRSIRDISLDMSPQASRVRDQYVAISRSWTDRLGNIVATGTMVDLRRGYVIIDGINGRVKIPYAKLSDADWAAVSDYWQIPTVCSVGDQTLPSRNWVPQTFTWTASALCHKPLYFENRQLERYGHTHGPILQPLHSAAHFFVSLATLPYATAIHPPTECRYALGYYRPGNCAPWLKDPLPISLNGLRRQALVTTGLGLLP